MWTKTIDPDGYTAWVWAGGHARTWSVSKWMISSDCTAGCLGSVFGEDRSKAGACTDGFRSANKPDLKYSKMNGKEAALLPPPGSGSTRSFRSTPGVLALMRWLSDQQVDGFFRSDVGEFGEHQPHQPSFLGPTHAQDDEGFTRDCVILEAQAGNDLCLR